MFRKGERLKYGVIERVKHSTLKWFSHIERLPEREITKRVYMSKVVVMGAKTTPIEIGGRSSRVCEGEEKKENEKNRGYQAVM